MWRLRALIVGALCASAVSLPTWAQDKSHYSHGESASAAVAHYAYGYGQKRGKHRGHHKRKAGRYLPGYQSTGYESSREGSVSYDYADVVNVEPIIKIVRVETPVEECWREEVQRPYAAYGQSPTPLILGGIIGGVVGNQLGSGTGNDLLTVGGAILGASVGYDVSRRHQPNVYRTELVTRCETTRTFHEEERIDGYRVTYVYNGRTYVRTMDYDPGPRLEIRVEVEPLA